MACSCCLHQGCSPSFRLMLLKKIKIKDKNVYMILTAKKAGLKCEQTCMSNRNINKITSPIGRVSKERIYNIPSWLRFATIHRPHQCVHSRRHMLTLCHQLPWWHGHLPLKAKILEMRIPSTYIYSQFTPMYKF